MPGTRSLAVGLLIIGSAIGATGTANAVEGRFRGAYVCEKLPMTRDILRVPLDMTIRNGEAQFARPLFGLNGPPVVGSELASGSVDGDGMMHLESRWGLLGNTAAGAYLGRITESGGTLTGTQTWTGAQGGEPVVRTCTIAVVPAPKIRGAALP